MKQRYPTYKSSGVEWIGEIPEGWECRLGTTIGDFFKGKGIRKDEVIESGNPCIRYGEIYTKYNHKVESVCSFISDDVASNSIKVNGSHILLTGSGELASEIGKAIIVNLDEVYIGGDIIILQTGRDFDPYYLTYLINSESVRIQRELAAKGEIVVHIYSKNFREMKFCCPSLHEQQQIVTYLDHKTTLIDQIITGSEKKIELLKEQRTATINHAVTKGLNPKVKMKDSGVEWIEEIPLDWSRMKMKRFAKICNGSEFKEHQIDFGGFPVYGTGGEFARSSKFIYNKISVLLGRKGTIDKPQLVREPFWTSDTVYYTEIKPDVSPFYFYYLVCQIPFGQYAYGSAIPSMTKSVYDEMIFPYPPLEEQHQIVTYLDQKTKEIDDLIASEKKRVELLKEYRQSLISEAVTGKIKVANG